MTMSEPTLAAGINVRPQEHTMYLPLIDGDDGTTPPPRPVWIPRPAEPVAAAEEAGEPQGQAIEFLPCDCPDDCPRDHPNE
jgi:hypothetical protein